MKNRTQYAWRMPMSGEHQDYTNLPSLGQYVTILEVYFFISFIIIFILLLSYLFFPLPLSHYSLPLFNIHCFPFSSRPASSFPLSHLSSSFSFFSSGIFLFPFVPCG
uniref:Uncharacterized protein n=1 Tax=Cacopsylla melanoneura TaxID=428564 RepID=A0A8D9BST6_9HEMI